MKIPSTFLYDLVKKLSKSEKRYIKVQSGSGEKDYIQLMDALLKQKSFDEEKLLKDYKEANFTKHLAVNKRYLYELIIKTLTNFGQKKIEDKVLDKIIAANILIEKGMSMAAHGELKKGQKIAHQYELFDLQILLFGIEKKLFTQQKFKTESTEAIHKIFDTEMNCLEQLKNTSEYWYLARQLVQFQKLYQKIQTEEQQAYIDNLINSPKFKNPDLATNIRSKLYFYQANASYQFTVRKIEKAYRFNQQFLDLLEANPHFLELFAERYLATLNNMLIDSLMIGKYDILEAGIDRLSKIVEKPAFSKIKNIEVRVFRQRYLLLLNWSLSQKDYDKALSWIPEIEEGLEKYGKKIEKHHRITFYYLVAYLLFINKKYDEALNWNILIIGDSKENVVKEIFYFSHVLNLVLHHELGNEKLLDSLLHSTPKYLKRRRNIYATEKALFQYLRKQLNSVDRKEKQEITVKFKNQIDELAKNPEESRVFNYLDLRLWLNN